MTISRKRVAAYAIVAAGFGLPILGALTPSYLHLSDWWRAMMPDGWQLLAYVAALTTEAVIVSCGVLRAVARGRLSVADDTLTRRVEWAAVIAAIYVNARWAALQPAAAPLSISVPGGFALADIIVGAAGLPLAARYGFMVLGIGWRWAATVDTAPIGTTGKAPRRTTVKDSVTVGTPAEVERTIDSPPPGGKLATDAIVASRAGVKPRTARAWRAAGDARYGQHMAEARAA